MFADNPTDPCLPGGPSNLLCDYQTAPPGSKLAFTTHLVGIQGPLFAPSACDTGVGFSWTSTFNGTSGGVAVTKSSQPVDSGSGTGGIAVTAYSGTPPSSSLPTLLTGIQVSVTVSDLGTDSAIVTITNVSDGTLNGPFQVVLDSLTSGVTLTNPAGTFGGWSYITVPEVTSLNPGQSASTVVEFTNGSDLTIDFVPIAYSGNMD